MPRPSPRRLALAAALGLALAGCTESEQPWGPIDHTWQTSSPHPIPGETGTIASEHIRSWISALAVLLFLDLPFGGMALVAAARALVYRRRALAEEAVDRRAPLAHGPAAVSGVVEDEPGGGPVVTLTIAQGGRNVFRGKGVVDHRWEESRRAVEARPFHVRRDDGTRVRVEPDDRVVVHETLLRTVRLSVDERHRIAEIRAGDRVRVRGEVAGATLTHDAGVYRGGEAEPVLRPPRRGPMVISSGPAGETERQLMRFHARSAGALAAVFVILSLAVAPHFQILTLDGQRVLARPTALRTWQTYAKPKGSAYGHWVSHYAVRAEAMLSPGADAAPVTLTDACGQDLYAYAAADRDARIPFVVSAHAPSVHLVGERPTLHWAAIFGMFWLSWLGMAYPQMTRNRRPWYEMPKLIERGSGRIEEIA